MKWLLLLLLFAFISAPLDLAIARYFYNEGLFSDNTFFNFLYTYGEHPSKITAALGLIYYIATRERVALYLCLTLVIGAFLINEQALKHHWGRPRPKQVDEFGGIQKFRPFYAPNFFAQPEPSRSFPCGHCTAGYYFISFAFLGKRFKNRSLFWFGLLFSALFGSLLGVARMAQGGHFFSDVVFGCLVMGLTAWMLDRWIWYERAYKTAS